MMPKTQNLLSGAKRVVFVTGFFILGHAHAHHVWLEQDANGSTLYFGEYGQNLREVSPGLLDRFGSFKVTKQTTNQTSTQLLGISKTTAGFLISAKISPGETIVAQDNTYPIIERKEGEKALRILYVPAARIVADAQIQVQSLTLDLVPTGKVVNNTFEFQAFFKGAPLTKAKIEVISVSGWSIEAKTGDDGKFSVALPWAATYVLELKHADIAGERAAGNEMQKFDRANYVTSLTITLTQGIAAPPAPSAITPRKM